MANGRGGAFRPRSIHRPIVFQMPNRDVDLRTAKKALRDRMRLLRKDIDAALAVVVRETLIGNVPLTPGPVAGYWPIGTELDIRPVLAHVIAGGGTALLPASGPKGTPLQFRIWNPERALISGLYGIFEPDPDQPIMDPFALLVPLLAFDRKGYRLGYGGGYYDRTLEVLRRKGGVIAIGVGFAAQEVPEVPHDRCDQRLDWIVTERGAVRIGNGED